MSRLLFDLSSHLGISINKFDGGNLRNAIPREAVATITINKIFEEPLRKTIENFYHLIKAEFGELEHDLKLGINPVTMPSSALDKETQSRLLKALIDCPHGVVAWSKDMEDLVETSTNLASVRFPENNIIEIITTQRSSNEPSKNMIAAEVEACFKPAGARVVHSDGYPGWKPNITSEILKITRSSYLKLFGTEPRVRAIHAGLECGLIYEKNKSIDMISFGPSIKGAHTPEEMISIESTARFWDLLIDVIQNFPNRI